jgi:hypothetical protein
MPRKIQTHAENVTQLWPPRSAAGKTFGRVKFD